MAYFLSFLEGIITFVSPCLLPILPVYLSYFAGGESTRQGNQKKTLINAMGFVAGFTLVFVLLGAAAGTFGTFVKHHQTALQIIGGIIIVIFGLSFMGLLRLGFLDKTKRFSWNISAYNPYTSALLGIIFSIGWTPCVGAFLGSALVLAANSQHIIQGIIMLLLYSLGLGVPFVISAVFINRLSRTFQWIKAHYRIINLVSGLLLVTVGLLMIFGKINIFYSLFR